MLDPDDPIIHDARERRRSAHAFDEMIDMADDHLRQPELTREQRMRFETIRDFARGWREQHVGRHYPKTDPLNLSE